MTIVLTWTASEHHGWEQFSSTVRHELIHAWQYHEFGDANHGSTFAQWTDVLNTPSTANASPRQSGGSCARIAAVEFRAIDARRRYVTLNSTVVVQFASRRATASNIARIDNPHSLLNILSVSNIYAVVAQRIGYDLRRYPTYAAKSRRGMERDVGKRIDTRSGVHHCPAAI
ncbi:SprT-like domain-containing protein [Haladaptatus sp. T7]|uniref:SprT-like domain-containing protein n=1 Tax=Haladaptatus sp. T7 TaxID=2029368 RepID=UPI00222E86AE|nr:SprT-like domain-containing protein [Haladaptatus sp. T7]